MHSAPPVKAAGRTSGSSPASIFPVGYVPTFLLTTLVFFVWGMSNNLTDILVQQFRKSFSLSLLEAQLVQTAVFLAYGTMAIPAALIMRRFGYKTGLLIGLVVFGVGTLLFWPAAILGVYAPFLIALFVVGCGSSVLETAANPMVAQFGAEETSEQRLNFAQSCNPPGTIVGVLIGTLFIFSGVEKHPAEITQMKLAGTYAAYLHGEILRVVPTYVGLGIAVLILAAVMSRARFPAALTSRSGAHAEESGEGSSWDSLARLMRSPHLVFAVIAQFFYVGTQISTWSTLIPYMRAYTAASERTTGYFLTGTLAALAVGRVFSTSLMRLFSPAKMIGSYAIVNFVLVMVAVTKPGMVGAWALFITSFFMSAMYPTIFALGVKDLGVDTKLGGSLLVMAIVGGAIFPPLMGWIARLSGSIALSYSVAAAGYVVVALYAFFSPRLGITHARHA